MTRQVDEREEIRVVRGQRHMCIRNRATTEDSTAQIEQKGVDEHPIFQEAGARYMVKIPPDQWAGLCVDGKQWYQDDLLSFYIWWYQRKTQVYTDPNCNVFPFYLPSGVQHLKRVLHA